jgi:hypothetical protein
MILMPRPSVLLLLLALPLGAAPPDLRLDLRTTLGTEPASAITLVPPGIWDGLFLASRAPARPAAKRRGRAEATVEVSDFFLPTNARTEAFRLFAQDLRERIRRGFQAPPPSQGQIELGEFMAADPSRPDASNLGRAQSLQERYNRVPPNGSPVEVK